MGTAKLDNPVILDNYGNRLIITYGKSGRYREVKLNRTVSKPVPLDDVFNDKHYFIQKVIQNYKLPWFESKHKPILTIKDKNISIFKTHPLTILD